MPSVLFENPTMLTGTPQEQLKTMYGYLFRLSEQLNEAMNSITVENMEPQLRTKIKVITTGDDQQVKQNEFNKIKSLIIKTADVVRHEMDEIRTTLEDNFMAKSDFGTYESQIINNVEATARGIMQEYNVVERIKTSEDTTEDLINRIRQYIFMGLIDTVIVDGENQNRFGIAIGNNVTDVDEDNNESLNRNNMCATFTMGELSFYVGGVKVAWFSNQMFYIDRGRIVSSLQIGNHQWKAMQDGGMVLVSVM